jgi:hypothetical protein
MQKRKNQGKMQSRQKIKISKMQFKNEILRLKKIEKCKSKKFDAKNVSRGKKRWGKRIAG